MDFSKIDFLSIEINSKNVYSYFANTVRYDIKNIKKLKEKRFREYAVEHDKPYKDIIKLYDQGFNKGIQIAKDKFNNSREISSEGGKLYLFEVASVFNISNKYFPAKIRIHFKKHFVSDFEPSIIETIGEIIGEYSYAWKQILKNHRIFETLFKPIMDKRRNSFFNAPSFPVHNVKIAELPESMSYAKDFAVTLERMNDIMVINFDWLDNGIMDNLNMSSRLRYDILKDLKSQFHNFLQETTNNTDNGIFEKHILFYQRIDGELKKCIELFTIRAKKYFTLDMSFIYEYHIYNRNWFIIVLDYLNQTNEAFQRIAKFKNIPTGFTCTLNLDIVKEVFKLMEKKSYLKGSINDFIPIFSNTPEELKKPITWLINRGEKGHKKSLWTFLNLMTGIKDFSSKVNKKRLETFFIDEWDNPIFINKEDERSKYKNRTSFKEIIDSAKHAYHAKRLYHDK